MLDWGGRGGEVGQVRVDMNDSRDGFMLWDGDAGGD